MQQVLGAYLQRSRIENAAPETLGIPACHEGSVCGIEPRPLQFFASGAAGDVPAIERSYRGSDHDIGREFVAKRLPNPRLIGSKHAAAGKDQCSLHLRQWE